MMLWRLEVNSHDKNDQNNVMMNSLLIIFASKKYYMYLFKKVLSNRYM